jgi:3-deoxy-D-manno-octulosonic-acid transferase
MLAWLLNLTYLALLAVVSPWLAYRTLTQGKYHHGLGQKSWGALPRRAGDRPCLWLHAVSVGEVLQLGPIIEGLRRQQPDLEIVISVTTTTGFDVARERFLRRFPLLQVVYYPLDFSWSVHRALERIRPTAIALVELELWPNFLFAAARRRIPVLVINGRISERSHRGYARIRPLVQAMLQRVRRILVQNETYADRFIALGAERQRIIVTGSIKFDGVRIDRNNPETRALARSFGLNETERVFIAGSTQAPEERFALDAWLAARDEHPDLRLILVPRHKERFEEVARLVEEDYHLPLCRRSRLLRESNGTTDPASAVDEGEAASSDARRASSAKRHQSTSSPLHHSTVLLLDTLGELSACWGLADIAFVGGSLTDRGGQNMIEPAAYGAVVLFGPNTWNFKDVVELLLERKAAFVVRTAAELTVALREFLADPQRTRRSGQQAQALVDRQRGATGRTVELLAATLVESQRTAAGRNTRAA